MFLSKGSALKTPSSLFQLNKGYKRSFGILANKILGEYNTNSPDYRIAAQGADVPLENEEMVVKKQGKESLYKITRLNNGLTVLTGSALYPGHVNFGCLLDVGVRDEYAETSGSLFNIKNSYLKTLNHTNETINAGMIEMSGGDYIMQYDQEHTFYQGFSLAHDVPDMVHMMLDTVFETKNWLAMDVGASKAQDFFKLKAQREEDGLIDWDERLQELTLSTAFGNKGLGNALEGSSDNLHNLENPELYPVMDFHKLYFNPNNAVICAEGVDHHEEFVDLVAEKANFIPNHFKKQPRAKAEYIGGEVRIMKDTPELRIVLAFESGSWQNPDWAALLVADTLLGSAQSFSTGGPGKGMHARITKNLLQAKPYISSGRAINLTFTDTGLFGIEVSGLAATGKNILNDACAELKRLTQTINAEELNRAKNLAKTNLCLSLEEQGDRMEEAVKNLMVVGDVRTVDNYLNMIDDISSERINKAFAKLLKGRPTFIAVGGEVNTLPSLDQIHKAVQA